VVKGGCVKDDRVAGREKKCPFLRLALEVDIPLDADVGAVDVGPINGHANVGSPGRVAPFNIQVVIGLEGRRKARVVRDTTLPFQGDVSIGVDCGGDAVIGVDLLRERHFLTVSRGRELDVGVVGAVVDHNVAGIVFEVETGVNRNASSVGIKALGGLDATNIELTSSRSNNMDVQVDVLVVGINLEVGLVKVKAFSFGTGRDTPARDIGANLTPDALGKGCDVRCGACMSRSTVGDIQVTRLGGAFPSNSGFQSVEAVERSITD